jgi:hypothetical protein
MDNPSGSPPTSGTANSRRYSGRSSTHGLT